MFSCQISIDILYKDAGEVNMRRIVSFSRAVARSCSLQAKAENMSASIASMSSTKMRDSGLVLLRPCRGSGRCSHSACGRPQKVIFAR